MAQFMGWQKYLNLRPETTWDTYDSGGTSIYVPYTEYSVVPTVTQNQAALFTGNFDQRHNRRKFASLGGNLNLPLLGYQVGGKSIAEYLMTWALNRAGGYTNPAVFLPSYTADVNDPATSGKRHRGLRVSSMTISGDAASGNINMNLALMGGTEQDGISVPSLSGTAPKPIDFNFSDIKFYLSSEAEGESATGGSEEVSLRSFELSVDNSLVAYHTNSYWNSVIAAGVRKVTFKFSVFKTDTTYDAFAQGTSVIERSGHLKLTCPHLGTGTATNTVIDIYFDRLNFNSVANQAALNELATQDVEWIALDPATSDQAIEWAFSTS